MNEAKKYLIKDAKILIQNELKTKEVITYKDVNDFMQKINPMILKYGHSVVKAPGYMHHLDRIQVKNMGRLIILQEIANDYHKQVIEYLHHKLNKFMEHE